jgi:hypothetical protein
MTIENPIYRTSTLVDVIRDDEITLPPQNYWLSLCFPSTAQFTTEEIDFSKLTDTRKIAPLVVPTAQGVPIYSNAEYRASLRPAYIKVKDAVNASRVIKRVAGFGELNSNPPMSPQERYDAIVTDILRQHRRAIERRWEWMASEAVQHGRVTLEDERYPRTLVDFERDPAHTVQLTGSNRWGETGVDILADIEGWKKIARRSKFGGPLNRLTVGTEAWDIMRKDQAIRDLLKTDYLPAQRNGLDISLGVLEGLDVEWVGRINGTTDVYVYSDYYENENGNVVEFMDPHAVVMTGPGVRGVRAFAAIQDINASFQPLEIFPKMWPEQDPSATFIMSQSAPLMVPMLPNNTFYIKVR